MRDHIGNPIDALENIVNCPHNDSAVSRRDTTNVLGLLSQAVETIRNEQYRAKESEARMKYLAKRAVENLKCEEAQIRSTETMCQATEQELKRTNAKLEQTEEKLMRALSRITGAEVQLTKAEERGRAMEARAINAESAFNQLERLIRSQLVGLSTNINKCSDLNRRSARAA
jgi:hypothetical protein